MITLTTAEKALKTVYLGAVANHLNLKANPFLAKMNQSTCNIVGNEIVKVAPYGVNGGFGALLEDSALPEAVSTSFEKFRETLKNLYGKIEISDKAVRASQSSSGAFVNLLNSEMESLIKTCSFHLARMLFGDGTGNLGNVVEHYPSIDDYVKYDDVRNFVEGMVVNFENPQNASANIPANVVKSVDRENNRVHYKNSFSSALTSAFLTFLPNSKNNELTGLGKIFKKDNTLYGVDRSQNKWLNPKVVSNAGQITDILIQKMIDELEDYYDSDIDYITCSSDVKRFYQEYLQSFRRNIDYMELNGGYKAMSYGGIPIVSDRFAPKGSMYILNSKDFNLYQLCDWTWLEGDDGRILKQNPGYATYSATLVKYAEMMCDRPAAQGLITGISSGSVDYAKQIATNTGTIATKAGAIATATGKLSQDYATVNATALESADGE